MSGPIEAGLDGGGRLVDLLQRAILDGARLAVKCRKAGLLNATSRWRASLEHEARLSQESRAGITVAGITAALG